MNNVIWAVLFDLDETLILSSALEPLRRTGDWRSVYAGFGRTSLPPATLDFLEEIRGLAKIGVVTKSPRTYAVRILAFHNIDIPVLAAYHDVSKRKPHPEALLLACSKLEVPPSNCLYVGDDKNDVLAARAAGMIPIGVAWGKIMPIGLDSVCLDWGQVCEQIRRIIEGQRNGVRKP